MAGLALCRKTAADMIGILRGVKLIPMARHTIRRLSGKHIIRMTIPALPVAMRSRERELGLIVIEQRPGPSRRRVARLTCRRESCRGVIGIRRGSVFRLVAGGALCWCGLEHLVAMTRKARCGNVGSRERESRQLMLETRPPSECRHLMALHTIRGKPGCDVIGRLCIREIVLVAAEAVRCGSRELLLGGICVAGLAGQRCMPTQQREPCRLMALHHIRSLPRLRCMAPHAVISQLTLVHIGVARQAVG